MGLQNSAKLQRVAEAQFQLIGSRCRRGEHNQLEGRDKLQVSTSPQIIESANSPITTDKPLKGKYDRRRFNGAHLRELNKKQKGGTKPLYLRQLCRSTSKRVLEEFERIASLADIYDQAWKTQDLWLCAKLQEDIRNRYFGKAFVSVNPDEDKGGGQWQDNRLQVAIQNLNIGQSGTKQLKGSKSQRNKGESLTIPPSKLLGTKATSDNGNYVTVTTTDGRGTSDDAGQPG